MRSKNPTFPDFLNTIRTQFEKRQATKPNSEQIAFPIETVNPKKESQDFPKFEKPLIPTVFAKDSFQIFDIPAQELARQLAMSSLTLIQNIQPIELLFWAKKKNQCPNLAKVVDHFNSLTQWAKTYIVTGCSVKQRAYIIAHIIAIMNHSLLYNNYHVVTALLAALQQIAISRLKKSWALVPPKSMQLFSEIATHMDPEGNWKHYRDKMNSTKAPPFIPYIGLVIQDIMFIDDGNLTKKRDSESLPELINWDKCMSIGAIFKRLIEHSDYCYPFVYLPEIEFVFNEAMNHRMKNDKEIYQMSVALEPKVAKNAS